MRIASKLVVMASLYNQVSRVRKNQIDWDAVRQQSQELNDSSMDRVVANVPKYTEVKKGQKYPVGKGGQLKMFHEHVWPKGYTPERMRGVVDATSGFISDNVGTDHSAHLANKVSETMARSTIPVDMLRTMTENASVSLDDDTDFGQFDHHAMEVGINPRVLGKTKNNKIWEDTSGTVASQITMHELGHLNDYLHEPDDFQQNDYNRSWYNADDGGLMASPALEGRAEGFRLATNRITRGMRRGNDARLNPSAGYRPEGFDEAGDQKRFSMNRILSFRHASGLDPYPRRVDKDKAPYDKTQLPGMEGF